MTTANFHNRSPVFGVLLLHKFNHLRERTHVVNNIAMFREYDCLCVHLVRSNTLIKRVTNEQMGFIFILPGQFVRSVAGSVKDLNTERDSLPAYVRHIISPVRYHILWRGHMHIVTQGVPW